MRDAAPQTTTHRAALRLGAGCTVVGALAIAGFRLSHGDLPAADAPAALGFIADHPFYAGVHIGTVVGVLAWAGGIVALTGTITAGLAGLLGRLATAAVGVGAAVFIVDFSIDGVAARTWQRPGRPPHRRTDPTWSWPPGPRSRSSGAPR